MEKPILPTQEGTGEANRFNYGIQPLRKLRFDGHRTPRNLFSNLIHFFAVTWLDWLTFVMVGATAAGVRLPQDFHRQKLTPPGLGSSTYLYPSHPSDWPLRRHLLA